MVSHLVIVLFNRDIRGMNALELEENFLTKYFPLFCFSFLPPPPRCSSKKWDVRKDICTGGRDNKLRKQIFIIYDV